MTTATPHGAYRLAPVVAGRVDWRHAHDLDARPLGVSWPAGSNMTSRRIHILGFIADHTRTYGFPPTFREIGDEVGVSSMSTVAWQVQALRAAGRVDERDGRARWRGLRLIKAGRVA